MADDLYGTMAGSQDQRAQPPSLKKSLLGLIPIAGPILLASAQQKYLQERQNDLLKDQRIMDMNKSVHDQNWELGYGQAGAGLTDQQRLEHQQLAADITAAMEPNPTAKLAKDILDRHQAAIQRSTAMLAMKGMQAQGAMPSALQPPPGTGQIGSWASNPFNPTPPPAASGPPPGGPQVMAGTPGLMSSVAKPAEVNATPAAMQGAPQPSAPIPQIQPPAQASAAPPGLPAPDMYAAAARNVTADMGGPQFAEMLKDPNIQPLIPQLASEIPTIRAAAEQQLKAIQQQTAASGLQIARYEKVTGRNFKDLSPEWQEFIMTGKEFKPSPLAVAQYEQEIRDKNIANMKASGDWEKLTPRQRSEVMTGSKSITPELRPSNIPGLVPGKDIPEGQDAFGNPIDKTAMYRVRQSPDGGREYFPELPRTQEVFVPDDQSKTKISKISVDAQGNETGRVRDVLGPPGYIPQTSVRQGVQMVTQPDGSIVAVPVTSTTTRTPAIGGAGVALPASPSRPPAAGAPPPSTPGTAGATVGGKPLPEATKERMDAQIGAIDNTLGLLKRVQQNMPVLNSLLAAGKINLATSNGGLAQVVSRGSNLTDQEAQMAADMDSLAEHINTLRGPLGATGFRGHEAFGALQSQRGKILGNPKVSAAIIQNTVDSLTRQRNALERSYQQHKLPVPQKEESPSLAPPPGQTEKVEPIKLKDGTTLVPYDAAAAAKFRKDHADKISQ